ncbi:hypothetical protein HRI_000248100 [Hibiscus trionum]|uniref:Uncharacterized protein n=1 Tax=Hibiscus trionum TaxID=183268 RepID=A0A9W7GV35_HIBTR|nr:hypothetical protein HRI_000248100 [Hibiscus trionum]
MSDNDSFWKQFLTYLSSNDCDSPTGTTGALQWFENVAPEAPDATDGPPSLPDDNRANSNLCGRNKRSRELVSANSAEAKGKGTMKRCRRRGPDESSTSGKRSKPTRKAKSYEELIDGKSVAESVKVLTDRIARKITNDKVADMESILFVVKLMMGSNSCHLLPQVLGSLKQIKTQWPMRFDIPVRSDIQVIKQNIKRIVDECKNKRLTEAGAKQELIKEEKEMEKLDQQREEDLKEVQNQVQKLEAIFLNNMEFSVETLRTTLASLIPWMV